MDKLNLADRGIQAALFDLDGVLLDSLHVWDKVALDFLHEKGAAFTGEIADDIRDMSFMQSAEYFVGRLNLEETPQTLIDGWNARAYAAYANEVKLMPGAAAYVQQLADNGVRLAVVTASDAVLAQAALERNGIAQVFETIVTEGGTGLDKSGPQIFLEAARALSVPPAACMVFEDSLYAVKSAKAAGMRVCAVCGPGGDAEALCTLADYCIESLEELMV